MRTEHRTLPKAGNMRLTANTAVVKTFPSAEFAPHGDPPDDIIRSTDVVEASALVMNLDRLQASRPPAYPQRVIITRMEMAFRSNASNWKHYHKRCPSPYPMPLKLYTGDRAREARRHI